MAGRGKRRPREPHERRQDTARPEKGPALALRRALVNAGGALVFPLFAILISFLIGAVIVLATGNNPLTAYAALVRGAVGSPTAIGRTLLGATPLIFTGLAVAVAFRAGLFNIGGEGQLYIGAITAAWLGVSLGFLGAVSGSSWSLRPASLTGFLWGAIPGFLKARFGAHEVITTIMLNYIGINLAYLPRPEPLRTEGLVPGTDAIDIAARIPFIGLGLGRANYGFLLALARGGGGLPAPVAHAAGVPDPGRRPLPGGGELRRHGHRREHRPGPRHRRGLRGRRRRRGGPRRLRQDDRTVRHQPWIQRHRGGAPRAQPPGRGGPWCPALRGARRRRPGDAVRRPTCRCSWPTCCSP